MSTYDSLGNAHTLSLYFVKTAANTYSVFAASDGVQVGAGAAGTLAFNTDGSLNTTATTLPFNLSIPVGGGATTPTAVAVDFTGTTQFGTTFGVNDLTQNGYTAGKLSGFSVGGDGTIVGRYSNGQTLAQGQIALASFTNSQGLAPIGNNQWTETSTSGLPLVGSPGAGVLGVLQSGAVEEANVDLTQELVNMITAQRIYQANAQTIKTEDSLLQTIVNLR
jgi:flagellar hook protein FlgE